MCPSARDVSLPKRGLSSLESQDLIKEFLVEQGFSVSAPLKRKEPSPQGGDIYQLIVTKSEWGRPVVVSMCGSLVVPPTSGKPIDLSHPRSLEVLLHSLATFGRMCGGSLLDSSEVS